MIFLCLGNSLTAGFPGYSPSDDGISSGYGNIKSQYEYWLKLLCLDYIENSLGKISEKIRKNLIFVNKGIPGELTSDFLKRINFDLVNYTPKPDYSIIIGGTNDLGWGIPNKKILENIKQLHEISREAGIFSIGALIPPIRTESSSGEYHKRKTALNSMLRDYFNSEKIPYADLFTGMVDNDGDLDIVFAYLDGLHFSVEGYKRMAEVIFEDILKDIIDKNMENFRGLL
ncbi:MAG: GDSL-type esterase/lipase family protein [Promethearchaeota archaeon]